MTNIARTLLLITSALGVLLLSTDAVLSEDLKLPAEPPDSISAFVQYISQDERIQSEDITESLPPLLPLAELLRGWSYEEVSDSLERRFKQVTALYPAGVLSEMDRSQLRQFKGKHQIYFPLTFAAPILLFCPVLLDRLADLSSIRGERLRVIYQGHTVYGLRVGAELTKPDARAEDSLSYIEDLNARLAGFTHGQLIEELSENIKAAEQFDYNGPRPWSEHQRYGPLDQFQAPLRLTNYAHGMGGKYVISKHPDFSLEPTSKEATELKMTFFLWRESYFNTMLSYMGKTTKRLPDFIFQIDLKNKQ